VAAVADGAGAKSDLLSESQPESFTATSSRADFNWKPGSRQKSCPNPFLVPGNHCQELWRPTESPYPDDWGSQ